MSDCPCTVCGNDPSSLRLQGQRHSWACCHGEICNPEGYRQWCAKQLEIEAAQKAAQKARDDAIRAAAKKELKTKVVTRQPKPERHVIKDYR